MYLREYEVSYFESLAAFFVERMLDVLSMGLLAALVLTGHPTYRVLIVGIIASVFFIILAVSRAHLPDTWIHLQPSASGARQRFSQVRQNYCARHLAYSRSGRLCTA